VVFERQTFSVPQMKLLEAASFFGTQNKHLLNEKAKGDFPETLLLWKI
jgi:hypothetical protein